MNIHERPHKKERDDQQDAELKLSTLMDSMPDFVCFKDGEGRWLEANAHALKVFQLENVDYKGKRNTELVSADHLFHDALKECDISDEAAWRDGAWRGEEIIPQPDGGAFVFDVIKAPSFNPDGSRKTLTIVGRDITQRKRAEESLRESDARFHALFERAPLGYQSLDEDGRFIEVNQAWLDALGYQREEIIGKWFGDFLPPELVNAFRERFPLFKAAGKIHSEFQMFHKDGRKRFIAFEGRIGYHPDGTFKQTHCILSDITEQNRIEKTLSFLASCGLKPGEDFFQELARYLGESLGMDFVCIDRLTGDCLTAQTEAMFVNGKFEDNVEYALKDTPCGDVVGETVCCFPEGVRHLFPKDTVLQDMSAESYIGVTLWGYTGKPIGLIAVIGSRPLANTQLAESILKLVAVRAAGELERKQSEEKLKQKMHDLERFNLLTVDRELRMVELKKEINAMLESLGKKPKYKIAE